MKEVIHYLFRDTSLGPVAMASSGKGICCVEFGDDRAGLLSRLKKCLPQASVEQSEKSDRSQLELWTDALANHLDNGHDLPDLPLDIRGTEFEMLVWNGLREIPEGQVLGYGEFAEKIGRPASTRAVASACGRNRIAVLVPCHRVVRSDGKPGGYRWGLCRKQALLETERKRARLAR